MMGSNHSLALKARGGFDLGAIIYSTFCGIFDYF